MFKKVALIALAYIGLFGSVAAADLSICIDGICIGRDRDGRGVEVRPDYPRRSRGADYLTCESTGGRYNQCHYDNFRVRNVRLVQQHSKTSCHYGRNWGFNWNSVWVDQGCRATFKIVRY